VRWAAGVEVRHRLGRVPVGEASLVVVCACRHRQDAFEAAVWVVDTNKEHLAVAEARKLNIPIIAILDTNCDPDVVDYPIPGNDDAIRSAALLTKVIASAVAEGLQARGGAGRTETGSESGAAAEPLAEWEQELLASAAIDTAPAGDVPAPEPVTTEPVTESVTTTVIVEEG
jgi:small subunit ribosomal protein S2